MIVPYETGKALPKCKDCKYYRYAINAHRLDREQCLHAADSFINLVSGERELEQFTTCSRYRGGDCGLKARYFEAKLPDDPQPQRKLTLLERCSRFLLGGK